MLRSTSKEEMIEVDIDLVRALAIKKERIIRLRERVVRT
jgi:hypothetical protein